MNPATLNQGMEAWARARGLPVPPRGTPAYAGLFTAWQRGGMQPNPLYGVGIRPSMSIRGTPEQTLDLAREIARSLHGRVMAGEPVGVFDTRPRAEKFVSQMLRETGTLDAARYVDSLNPRTPNRSDFSELGGIAEARQGSLVSKSTEQVLQALVSAFGGGRAFTREEMNAEMRTLRGAQGQLLSPASTNIRAGHALAELQRKGFVERAGREQTPFGEGAQRFLLTLTGEQRSDAGAGLAAEREAEDIVARQVAALETRPPVRSPLSGPVYRPTIHIQETPGHKLPPLQKERIREAGYRTCNPTDEEMRALERAASLGDRDALLRLRRDLDRSGRAPPWSRQHKESIEPGDLFIRVVGGDIHIHRVDETGKKLMPFAHSNTFRRQRMIHYDTKSGPGSIQSAPDFTVARLIGGPKTEGQTNALIRKYFPEIVQPGMRVHIETGPGMLSPSHFTVAPIANPTGSPLSGLHTIGKAGQEQEVILYRPKIPRGGRPRLYLDPEHEAVLLQQDADEMRLGYAHAEAEERKKRAHNPTYHGPIRSKRDADRITAALIARGQTAAASYLARDWRAVAARPDQAYEMSRLAGLTSNPLTGIEANKILEHAVSELASLTPTSSPARRLEHSATAYEDAAIVMRFGPRVMHGNAARLQGDAGRALFSAQDRLRHLHGLAPGSIPTPTANPLTRREAAELLDLEQQHRRKAGQSSLTAMRAFEWGRAAGLDEAVVLTAKNDEDMRRASSREQRAIRGWGHHANPFSDPRQTLSPAYGYDPSNPILARVTGARDQALAARYGERIGGNSRQTFQFTPAGWAALVAERDGPRAPNPVSLLILGNKPHGAPARPARLPRGARRPNPHERGDLPPPGTIGLDEVRAHHQMFHGVPVREWQTIEIDDGSPYVQDRAVTALGLTEATVYRTPWPRSNKHAGGVYEHIHEKRQPVEVYDPVSHTSTKVLLPGSGPSDWWRDNVDPVRELRRLA